MTGPRAVLGLPAAALPGSLRSGLAATAAGGYPLAALGTLVAADGLAAALLPALAPDISAALGVSRVLLTLLAVTGAMVASLAGLAYAALTLRRGGRARMSVGAAAAVAVATLATAFVTAPGGIVAAQFLVLAVARGAVPALHRPLVVDHHVPGLRVRALCAYRGAALVGGVLVPVAVLGLAAGLDLTWRSAYLLAGVAALAAAALALRLRDPGPGHQEGRALSHLEGHDAAGADSVPSFFEATRRVMLARTFRLLLVVWVAVGMLTFPLASFLAFLLDERFDTGPGGRLAVVAAGAVAALAALAAFGRWGEAAFAAAPRRLAAAVSVALGVGGLACVVAGAAPARGVAVAGALLVAAAVAVAVAGLDALTLHVVEPRLRVVASALSGLFVVGLGTVSGVLLLGGLDRRFGIRWAVAALALPALLGALAARKAAAGVEADLDRLADREVSRAELRAGVARGQKLPLLACSGIDFAYGQLQVLFDVSFTVDEGEMVALLGTNGAGKSTLLRVISGLGFPRRGSVSYRGEDVTYLDAERRVAMGVTQVSGGQAVFGPLTVVENLRVYGYTVGRSKRRVEAGIDAAFAAFPRLAERRSNPASTLSGGEQQMLGLAKALLLEPKLLLIDELSLGLAPVVVGQLLGMVERINAAGTAVVLVEQSVNVALSLVSHAYFMEKGEIRFDGPARDLLERRDLLRSVFLEGAGRTLG